MVKSVLQPGPAEDHYHLFLGVDQTSTAEGDYITQETLDDALAALDFPPDVVNNFVTNVAVNETFVTELVTNESYITELTEVQQFIQQTVNQITEVEENNTYIEQITQNQTFVTNVTQTINANKGQINGLASLDTDQQVVHNQIPSELRITSIPFVIDGGGSAITTGIKGDFEIPFAHEITAWRLFADVSGSIVIDLWRDTYANYPPVVGDSVATSKPTLSSAIKAEDTTITDWNEAGAIGSIYRVNVDSATTVGRVTLSLTVRRTF